MTKGEQVRLTAWRLRVLQQAADELSRSSSRQNHGVACCEVVPRVARLARALGRVPGARLRLVLPPRSTRLLDDQLPEEVVLLARGPYPLGLLARQCEAKGQRVEAIVGIYPLAANALLCEDPRHTSGIVIAGA